MPDRAEAGLEPQLRPFLQAAASFRDRADTPRAFLERCIEAIDRHEAPVGAFVATHLQGARAAADEATARWKAGQPLSPIDGMPVGVKDIVETADMPTGQGSPLFAGWRGGRDAAAVAALREAGAVVVGKTVTTEFASTEPGPTRNPWDLARTPGGSSSGSAAAVAAGMVAGALGSQVIGSTIRPASYCGCFGFKPTVGAINRGGSFDEFSQSCMGVLAATLDDAWVLAREIASRAGGDPGCRGLAGPREPPSATQPRRVAFLETAGWAASAAAEQSVQALRGVPPARNAARGATVEAKQALDEVRRRLRAAGIEVIDRTTDDLVAEVETAIADAFPLSMRINAWEGRWPLNTYARDMDRTGLSRSAQARLALGNAMTLDEYRELIAKRDRIRAVYDELRRRCDVCLTLAAPGAAPVGIDWTGDPTFAVPASLLGVPALSLPVLRAEGLPLGLQLIGFMHDDAQMFGVAAGMLPLVR